MLFPFSAATQSESVHDLSFTCLVVSVFCLLAIQQQQQYKQEDIHFI